MWGSHLSGVEQRKRRVQSAGPPRVVPEALLDGDVSSTKRRYIMEVSGMFDDDPRWGDDPGQRDDDVCDRNPLIAEKHSSTSSTCLADSNVSWSASVIAGVRRCPRWLHEHRVARRRPRGIADRSSRTPSLDRRREQ